MSRRVLALVLALAAIVAGVVGYTLVRGSPPAPAAAPSGGWSAVWRDDFNGPAGAAPDPGAWLVDTGTGYPGGAPHWGTDEVQRYTADPANLRQDGKGHLLITPLRDADGGWTSARIETRRRDFRPAAGSVLRMESRLQLPDVTGRQALGYWPSFWALGAGERTDPNAWPGIGEFDVVENVNGDNTVRGTMHCGVGQGGPCNERVGLGGTAACPGGSCHTAFHTYAVEWDRSLPVEELRWYVDHVRYWTVKATDVSPDAWAAATTAGDFLLLNLAIGGQFPDALAPGVTTPTPETKPGVPMIVDYVAVLQRGGAGSASSPSAATAARSFPALTGDKASAKLAAFDFGSEITAATAVTASYRSASEQLKLELRIDSPTGPTIGALDLPAGSTTVTGRLHIPTKGVHDLYLTLIATSPTVGLTLTGLTAGR
ncbi:hypothetical protein ABIA32_004495 [Streptacidiphilus sp. MAP12-20]|uniref:family 16 glycosylhydrolase n=1 Tax=Streptacidiphilus sp. MAP12-20 TaxID=3156299 RepID=UPI0035193AE8